MPYSYRHSGHVKPCYYKDCNDACKEMKMRVCDKSTEVEKILYMFRGTIFEYLLGLRRNN